MGHSIAPILVVHAFGTIVHLSSDKIVPLQRYRSVSMVLITVSTTAGTLQVPSSAPASLATPLLLMASAAPVSKINGNLNTDTT